tara:strand:- start:48 stop:164 length:117 start_codon:yes stop_codon:yes gene_type:complete
VVKQELQAQLAEVVAVEQADNNQDRRLHQDKPEDLEKY